MGRKLVITGVGLIVIAALAAASHQVQVSSDSPQVHKSVLASGIGALGRLEPHTRVIRIDGPAVVEPASVGQLLVEIGDLVAAGQPLAILESHRREQADVQIARAMLTLAEWSLAQVLAGAKPGELAAQEAQIARTRARLELAEKQLVRANRLAAGNAITPDELDIRSSERDVLQRELLHDESTLTALREVRAVDVAYAEAEISRAGAQLERAEADAEASVIRSPIDGRVLRISTLAGERIGTDGLLEIGDTRQMNVVAEVHESDILKARLKQPAIVILRDLENTLHGRVIEIGQLVGRKDVMSSDPIDDTDARVVEVRIRLNDDSAKLVAGMSYARVEVRIETAAAATNDDCCAAELYSPGVNPPAGTADETGGGETGGGNR